MTDWSCKLRSLWAYLILLRHILTYIYIYITKDYLKKSFLWSTSPVLDVSHRSDIQTPRLANTRQLVLFLPAAFWPHYPELPRILLPLRVNHRWQAQWDTKAWQVTAQCTAAGNWLYTSSCLTSRNDFRYGKSCEAYTQTHTHIHSLVHWDRRACRCECVDTHWGTGVLHTTEKAANHRPSVQLSQVVPVCEAVSPWHLSLPGSIWRQQWKQMCIMCVSTLQELCSTSSTTHTKTEVPERLWDIFIHWLWAVIEIHTCIEWIDLTYSRPVWVVTHITAVQSGSGAASSRSRDASIRRLTHQ